MIRTVRMEERGLRDHHARVEPIDVSKDMSEIAQLHIQSFRSQPLEKRFWQSLYPNTASMHRGLAGMLGERIRRHPEFIAIKVIGAPAIKRKLVGYAIIVPPGRSRDNWIHTANPIVPSRDVDGTWWLDNVRAEARMRQMMMRGRRYYSEPSKFYLGIEAHCFQMSRDSPRLMTWHHIFSG